MLPDRTSAEGAMTVTLGLLDGMTKVGRMEEFSPQSPDHRLEVRGHDNTYIPLLFMAENLMFVGFHHDGTEKRPLASGSRSVRVHLVGGRTFNVDVAADALHSPLGFYAIPQEPDSPFKELFFYAHGVNAKEGTEPLGVRWTPLSRQKLAGFTKLFRGRFALITAVSRCLSLCSEVLGLRSGSPWNTELRRQAGC